MADFTARELAVLADALTHTTGDHAELFTLAAKVRGLFEQAEAKEKAASRIFEPITAEEIRKGDTISFRLSGSRPGADRFAEGTVIKVKSSRDGWKDPMIVSVRYDSGLLRHHELAPTMPVRRYV